MNNTKEVQTKLMKGLLDLIILQFLNGQPMHGYQIITKIRRSFGVYFGPSTIYPLLGTLEKKGFVKSHDLNPHLSYCFEPRPGEGQNSAITVSAFFVIHINEFYVVPN